MTKYIPLTQGFVALVDDEDYEGLRQYHWYVQKCPNIRYAQRGVYDNYKAIRFYMHRDIMSPPPGLRVKHRNGDGLDNQRSNLVLVTYTEIQRNRRPNKFYNSSGYKGVQWSTWSGKWRAGIKIRGEIKYLGSFDDPVEAALAYDEAAKKLFREFARTNF